MSLNSTEQTLPDVEEQEELSTSSENQHSEVETEEASQGNEEQVDGASPQEAQPPSTEPKAKKPRHRKVDAEMRALEDRMITHMDERFAQVMPTPPTNPIEGTNAPQISPEIQLLTRRTQQFNQELTDLRTSHDAEDQAMARTIDDGIAGRNALADINSGVIQQLLLDGISPDELSEWNKNYGEAFNPHSAEVELRTIRRQLRTIRGGNAQPKQGNTEKVTPIRKPHKPVTTIPGTSASLRGERSAEALEKRFRGQ